MAKNRLFYLPLGGAGEIGMNMYVYGYGQKGRERLLVVDAGIAFPDMETTPGIDHVMPDIAWLQERAERIEGIFLSHAHEDHVGAIARIQTCLGVPVYARAFTAHLAWQKFEEMQLESDCLHVVDASPARVNAGPFSVGFLPVPHSIPEASSLVIDCPAGRIVHTGDFKLNSSLSEEAMFSHAGWKDIRDSEILALICDSTNVFVKSEGRAESSLTASLTQLIADSDGMVAATTFASNITRVRQLAQAGARAGRSVVLLGRAMLRMTSAAVDCGIVDDFPPFLAPESALGMKRHKLLLLTTGSQGELRSASAQLSHGNFRGFRLIAGDTFLLSSKTIPGNELSVARVVNRFASAGIRVIDDDEGAFHVSGHANRPDLTHLQKLLSPRLVVPMHGEYRHLVGHAELARENGFRATVVGNGKMADLQSGEIVGEDGVAGRTYLDGTSVISAQSGVVRDRLRMARDGMVSVSINFATRRREIEIAAKCKGIYTGLNGQLDEFVIDAIDDCVGRLNDSEMADEERLEREVSIAVRREISARCGKRPMVSVLLTGMS